MDTALKAKVVDQWRVDFGDREPTESTRQAARYLLKRKGCSIFEFKQDYSIGDDELKSCLLGYIVDANDSQTQSTD